MLNILIADEDINNLKGIKSYIDANFMQFEVLGSISEEREFYKFFKTKTVDIIILEIRFLGVDSFQKIKNFAKANPNTKFIVYGNISDVPYLKECLNIGAISYAIRPVKPIDLKKCLDTATDYFKSANELKKEEKMLDMEYLQNFKVFENKFLSVLINEIVFSKEEIENSFEYFNMHITSPYKVAIVRIDSFRKHIISKTQKEKHMLIFKILKIINSNIKNAKAFINLFNEVVIIFGGDIKLDETLNCLSNIKLSIKESMNIDVSCGVGRKYPTPNKIRTSFVEADTALRYRCIVGYNSVIPIDFVEPENVFSARYPYEKEKALVYTAVIGEYEYCLKLLDEIFDEIKDFKSNFEKIISQVTFSIVLAINRLSFEQGLKIDPISNFFPSKSILQLKNIEEARIFLEDSLKNFCEYITNFRNEANIKIYEDAIKYIEDNFFDNITYKSLARTLNCNPRFFRKIFEKNAKMSLPDYIIKFKVEKAKEMILQTTLTDDIIALKLGYDDVSTFRQNFKKIEGCLVGDFRMIHKEKSRKQI